MARLILIGITHAQQKLKDLLAKCWSLCRQRQNEIDSSSAHGSDNETLYGLMLEGIVLVKAS